MLSTPTPMSGVSEWLAYIEQQHPKSIDLGLERVQSVLAKWRGLSLAKWVVTVAGTNGKGSCAYALEQLLLAADHQVGRYSSPHLFEFNERIHVNGNPIEDKALCDAFEHVYSACDEPLTFFEFTTLAALWHFSQNDLDVVILEVGLGGRLDAVNAIDPDMAIITSIGFDHQEYLGNSLEQIAAEKAGIIRSGIPLLLGDTVTQQKVKNIAEHNAAVCYRVSEDDSLAWVNHLETTLPKTSVKLALAAYTVLRSMGLNTPEVSEIANILPTIALPGRMQSHVYDGVHYLFDVAHNEMAAQALAKQIKARTQHSWTAIWASASDKALDRIIEPMRDCMQKWYVPELECERINREQCIQELRAMNVNVDSNISDISKIHMAIREQSSRHDVLVFGSFYTVAAVLSALN